MNLRGLVVAGFDGRDHLQAFLEGARTLGLEVFPLLDAELPAVLLILVPFSEGICLYAGAHVLQTPGKAHLGVILHDAARTAEACVLTELFHEGDPALQSFSRVVDRIL